MPPAPSPNTNSVTIVGDNDEGKASDLIQQIVHRLEWPSECEPFGKKSPAPKFRSVLQLGNVFEQVQENNTFNRSSRPKLCRPKDWPEPGPINLDVQDLPHDSSDAEWWYVNCHLECDNGQEYSCFASFFRIQREVNENEELKHYNHLTWAIIDPLNQKYHFDPLLDYNAPEFLIRENAKGLLKMDSHLSTALLEVLNAGNVPLPDRLASKPAVVEKHRLSLDLDGCTFYKDEFRHYHTFCKNENKKMEMNLHFAPKKDVIRQANDGIVETGREEESMFYYSIPRLEVTGSIVVDGIPLKVKKGTGWYDHEFGSFSVDKENSSENDNDNSNDSCAWNWLSCQLNDGTDVTAKTLTNTAAGFQDSVQSGAIIVSQDGERSEYSDIKFHGIESSTWSSPITTNDCPQFWELSIPHADLYLTLRSEFQNQEFISLLGKPGFWEGRLTAQGTFKGQPVSGLAFMERHGHTPLASLDVVLKRISKQTLFYVNEMLPLLPSAENVRDLLGKSLDIQTEGLNLSAYGKSIIHPVREIIDRKGKAWRSFTTLLCIDAVGGDSNRFHHWLAFPEVLHTGSLMIDDIQDKSETRRGGPSAHMIYGEAATINAGCCAYFTSLQWAIKKSPELTSRERIFVYEKYFECLTAAHGGQALDIHGLDYLMPEAVKTGDPDSILEKSVREIHRLKSGVPAGSLAQVGAFLGGGSSKQVECLGKYFETVGVAFQIIDDVLNLTGLPGKTRGEDITAGKVTYPVAKAMRLLSNETDRQDIWNSISSKVTNQEIVIQIIGKLESCGAVEACVQDANKIVEDAWRELNPVIPDSLHKIFIRAFGSFVLERHY